MAGITFTLRVTAPDPRAVRVSVRRQQFSIGRPLELDESSPHVSAMEYALGAAGGEVVNGLRTFAARRRLAIDAVEAIVTGELEHGLMYLEVIGEQGTPKLARLHIKVFVACVDEPATRELFEQMLDRLPLVCTLRAATRVDVEWVFTV